MLLSIVDNRSGDEYLRRLAPRESLDLRAYVRAWVERETDGEMRASFSEPGSHIPSGCGDYHAEIRRTKTAGGSCWTAEAFFIE